MKMKKVLAMALALVLAMAIGVGATLAYLMDTTETKVNTFTVGNVDITLNEVFDEENAKLLPEKKNLRGVGFYIRLDDGNGAVRYFPKNPLFGSLPWTRWEYTYRTSNKPLGTIHRPYMHFTFSGCSGRVWVDQVEFVEVPETGK